MQIEAQSCNARRVVLSRAQKRSFGCIDNGLRPRCRFELMTGIKHVDAAEINPTEQTIGIVAYTEMTLIHVNNLSDSAKGIGAIGRVDEEQRSLRQLRRNITIEDSQVIVIDIDVLIRRRLVQIDVGLKTERGFQKNVAFGDEKHTSMQRATNDGPGLVVNCHGILGNQASM